MRLIVSCVAVAVAGMLAGCGEPSQNVVYEGGKYAGKPDTPAWQGGAFSGSRDDWEVEIKKRGKLQSEYTRLKGGA